MPQMSLFPVLERLFVFLVTKTSVPAFQEFRYIGTDLQIRIVQVQYHLQGVKDDLQLISEGQSVVAPPHPTHHLHCGNANC
jgi:hypothetical protein